jgi:CO/xanthine dehydrogenase Mo-binding subunit
MRPPGGGGGEDELAFERELREHEVSAPLHRFAADRRDFLKLLGGGMLVCLCAPALSAQESGGARAGGRAGAGAGAGRGGHELPRELAAWLHVHPDGSVTVFTGKVEVGQNIRTSLAQQVAEELRLPVAAIRMVMGDTDLTPWDAGTFGSRTTPYLVANQRIQFHPAHSPLRQGSYRGLAATANHFARESHMDELAAAAGIEPLRFRLQNLAEPRLRAVLEAAAAKFGWGSQKAEAGRGFGIADGTEKGGYVAACVEVEIEPAGGGGGAGAAGRAVRLRRVVEAFECGAVVNPDGLRNQVEGAVVQAIGGALFEAVEFAGGRITNPRLGRYRVPRFTDLPRIETVVLDRRDLPSAGAGETPIVALAPAVANAIFAATGVRLRGLPLVPRGVLPGPPGAPAASQAPAGAAPATTGG